MPRIKLTLEYDGEAFVGWQVQPNGRSVQAVLEAGLLRLLGEPTPVEVAGRTDAGVHALGQVASFSTSKCLPLKAYWRGLNGLLPRDVAVVSAEEVDPSFDPRRQAGGKWYRYLISNRPHRSPTLRRTHWEVFAPLCVEAMVEGAACLIGRHDFSSFRAANCQALHPVRELRSLRIEGRSGDELAIQVEGTAFLKHMVRNLVGTLAEVGRGQRPPAWVGEVLLARDRTLAGPTAPPHGLTLVRVHSRPPAASSAPEGGSEEGSG